MDLDLYKLMDPNSLFNKGSMTFIYSKSGELYFKPYPTTHHDMCLYDDIFDDVFQPEKKLNNDQKLSIAKQRNLQIKNAIMGRLAPYHGDIIIAIWNKMDHYLFNPFIKTLIQKHPEFKEASVVVVGKEEKPMLLSDILNTQPVAKKKVTATLSPKKKSKPYSINGQQYTIDDLMDLRKRAHSDAAQWDKIKLVLCHPDMEKYPELQAYIPAQCNKHSTFRKLQQQLSQNKMRWSDAMQSAGISYENFYFKNWLLIENLNTISAEDVLNIIKSSPNQQTRENWQKYAERWGITGTFEKIKVPALSLAKLVENHRMYISKYDEADVNNKMKNRNFNPVIIGTEGFSQFPFVVLDGTHSLVAAARLSHQTKQPIVLDVICPQGQLNLK
jgi:hypothetical protein